MPVLAISRYLSSPVRELSQTAWNFVGGPGSKVEQYWNSQSESDKKLMKAGFSMGAGLAVGGCVGFKAHTIITNLTQEVVSFKIAAKGFVLAAGSGSVAQGCDASILTIATASLVVGAAGLAYFSNPELALSSAISLASSTSGALVCSAFVARALNPSIGAVSGIAAFTLSSTATLGSVTAGVLSAALTCVTIDLATGNS